MKRIIIVSAALFGLLTASAATISSWPKGVDPLSIGTKVANRILERPYNGIDYYKDLNYITYLEDCAEYGVLEFSEAINDTVLRNRLVSRFYPLMNGKRQMVKAPTHVDYSVFGIVPLKLYQITHKKEYLNFGLPFADLQWTAPNDTSAQEARQHKKLLDKGLSWQTRFWIDDMFMICMLQKQAYLATGNSKYLNRAAFEMATYLDSLQNEDGLFYHSQNCPFLWGRGNGWVAVGMAELLQVLPKDNAYRQKILSSYLKMMSALKKLQKRDGLWGQLLDEPNIWPETSGSSMFTYAMIVGVKKGLLKESQYSSVIRRAWLGLISYLTPEGDLRNVCVGTNKKNDRQYYWNRDRLTGDFHGQSSLLWCAWALMNFK